MALPSRNLRFGRFAGGRDDNLRHVATPALAHHVAAATDGITGVKNSMRMALQSVGTHVDDPAAHAEIA